MQHALPTKCTDVYIYPDEKQKGASNKLTALRMRQKRHRNVKFNMASTCLFFGVTCRIYLIVNDLNEQKNELIFHTLDYNN